MNVKKLVKWVVRARKEREILPVLNPIGLEHILKGKTAIVTGGSSGIGLAICKRLIQSGCQVIACGTNEAKLQKICKEVNNDNFKTLQLNVLDISEFETKIKEACGLFPENKIDILINCAGVAGKEKFGRVTESEYDTIMNINVKGTFFMSQAIANYMISNGIKGHILNITSSSALRPAWTPYQMSKWAIDGFTRGLADSLIPYDIVVNAIGPGQTATPMLGMKENDSIYHHECPAGRYVTPEEIANFSLFLVSDMGNMIIGDTVYITGGSGIISLHK